MRVRLLLQYSAQSMANLSFKLIEDGAASGMSIGYLHDSTQSFTPIAQEHASILWDFMSVMSRQRGCVVVWWVSGDGPQVTNANAVRRTDETLRSMEPTFWKGFREKEQFVFYFPTIWNTSTGAQLYPTSFGEQIPDIVASRFFDRSDAKKLSMDYSEQNRPTLDSRRSLFVNLRRIFRPVWTFARNFRNADSREELMNPFRSLRDSALVKELGLYMRKGSNGDCLELLTTSPDISDSLRGLFDRHGIPCSFSKELRSSWG